MSSAKLVMTFAGTNGSVTMSYGNVKTNAATSHVKALVNGIIANGSIFANTPVSAKSAKVVITSENVVDISD